MVSDSFKRIAGLQEFGRFQSDPWKFDWGFSKGFREITKLVSGSFGLQEGFTRRAEESQWYFKKIRRIAEEFQERVLDGLQEENPCTKKGFLGLNPSHDRCSIS